MITFTQGDTAVLNLTAQTGYNPPSFPNLTGAVFTTYMVGIDETVISFPNSQHTANPDQVTNPGQFTLSLASTDTMNVNVGENKMILTLIEINGTQIYYRGYEQLTVWPPIPNR